MYLVCLGLGVRTTGRVKLKFTQNHFPRVDPREELVSWSVPFIAKEN